MTSVTVSPQTLRLTFRLNNVQADDEQGREGKPSLQFPQNQSTDYVYHFVIH
jgi:hypothetical protein